MKLSRGNPAQQSGVQGVAVDPPSPSETVLVVGLWASPPVEDHSDGLGDALASSSHVAVPSSAFAMVNDLLSVDGGQLGEASQDRVSASFKQTVHAVNAARHLQRLIRGFSRASTAGPVHASFTLMSAQEADGGNSASVHTCPGQILCVGGLCDTILSIPGLQFTNLPAEPSGSAVFPGAVLQLLPPVHMEGYVNEVLEPRISAQPPATAESTMDQPAALIGKMQGRTQPASYGNVPIKTINPRLVIGGVAGVVVVGTILIFSPLLRKSPHPVPQPDQPNPIPASQPASLQPTPVAAPPSPAAPEPSVKAHESTATKQKDPAHSRSAPPAIEQTDATPPRPNRSGMNFSSSEIEALIVRADKDAGNGAYDRAILEYRTALNYDPSNALAKKGLAKAEYNKSHQ